MYVPANSESAEYYNFPQVVIGSYYHNLGLNCSMTVQSIWTVSDHLFYQSSLSWV